MGRERASRERSGGYRAQLARKDELIKAVSRKLAKYSKQLQENSGDATISDKINECNKKMMRLSGINDQDLVDQMEDMRLVD